MGKKDSNEKEFSNQRIDYNITDMADKLIVPSYFKEKNITKVHHIKIRPTHNGISMDLDTLLSSLGTEFGMDGFFSENADSKKYTVTIDYHSKEYLLEINCFDSAAGNKKVDTIDVYSAYMVNNDLINKICNPIDNTPIHNKDTK